MLLLIVLAGLTWAYFEFKPATAPPLQAFINANVVTMDDNKPRAEAVLVEGNKIIATGTTKEVTGLVQSHPKKSSVVVHDLSGKTLLPGFIDAHSHFPASGVYQFAVNLNPPPIAGIENIDQIQSALRKFVDTKEPGEWVLGLGYDDTLLAESRHPFKQELDAVSTKHPIFILHISGHLGVANSLALKLLKDENAIAHDTEDDGDANHGDSKSENYVKNQNGQLTGLLLEDAVFLPVNKATGFSTRQLLTLVKSAVNEYAKQGFTTVQNGAADQRYITGLRYTSLFGLVPQRLIVWPMDGQLSDKERLDIYKKSTEKFQLGAIKIIVDGSIQGYTGYLSQPYHKTSNHLGSHAKDANYRGAPLIPRTQLVEIVKGYFSQNQALAIHGNGDAAIDDILHAVGQAVAAFPDFDHRTVLVHAQMARLDQLRTMKVIGVTPSFFSAHTYYWGDRHRDIFLGNSRASKISPARSAERLGLIYSIHLDSPVVPINSTRLLWTAVTRESSSGRVIGRRERLNRDQALRAITINAAYQVFKEDQIGSIEVGKFADFVVMNQDPSSSKVDLLTTTVERTYVGGVEIYHYDKAAN